MKRVLFLHRASTFHAAPQASLQSARDHRDRARARFHVPDRDEMKTCRDSPGA